MCLLDMIGLAVSGYPWQEQEALRRDDATVSQSAALHNLEDSHARNARLNGLRYLADQGRSTQSTIQMGSRLSEPVQSVSVGVKANWTNAVGKVAMIAR